MTTLSVVLVVTLMQPSAVAPCSDAEPVKAGDTVRCEGILWSLSATRRAVECKEVTVPKLKSLLTRCETTNTATIDYLERRASSAESALRLVPKPTTKVSLIMAALTVLSVGFLGGFVLGSMQ